MRFYAGIGSRRAPPAVEQQIREVAEYLNDHDYCLRSGGAPGCDTWFERYASTSEIYLPWPRFNEHPSLRCRPSDRAFEIASRCHPAWDRLDEGARKLHARNVHQVLGADLRSPVDFVVCWTPGGQTVGGTATAMRVALDWYLPIFNLAEDQQGSLFPLEPVVRRIAATVAEIGRR